jgi:hypothetical protein
MTVYAWSRWNKRLLWVLASTVRLATDPGAATAGTQDWLPEQVQLHGFLSQGWTQSNANHFFGSTSDGAFQFRELGINASYQPVPNLLMSAQLLSRTAGAMDDGQVRLDYGLIDYAAVMNPDLRLGLRAGRLKNPLGFYNDTRDVPFTRPSIFLPQSIYFDEVRNLELSADGGGFYADLQTGPGLLSLQVNVGELTIDDNVEYVYLGGNQPGKLTSDEPWWVGRLMYELDGGRIRLAVSRAVGTMAYEPGAEDYLGPGRIDSDLTIWSAQYNAENWSLTTEYMREPVVWRQFNIPAVNRSYPIEGYYVQGTYRVLPDWTLLLRYDQSYLNKHDKSGEQMQATTGYPAHDFFGKDITVGLRWDLTSAFMLRAEYHRIDGASWLSQRENLLSDTQGNWDLFALQASWRF